MTKIMLREKAREMRKHGKSYTEIQNELGVSRSSVSYWVRDIELTDEQQASLVAYRYVGRKHTNEEKIKIGESSRKAHAKYKEENGHGYTNYSNSVYRKHELYAKSYIEERFNCNDLKPEQISDNWYDFCNDTYIIELTFDNTHGINNALNRLKNVQNDPRTKFLICPSKWFGKNRRNLLESMSVIHIPLWFEQYREQS